MTLSKINPEKVLLAGMQRPDINASYGNSTSPGVF